ncbi:hypothetical protein FRC08_007093 [Ceratobasidium sp. 394]|nr:hypothetical protein FRC08_007093 [Ceratobasidium sp. 394]
MVAYNRYAAINSGQLGRRVVSGPSVLTKREAQTLIGDHSECDVTLPSYAPKAKDASEEGHERGREQSPRLIAPRFSRRRKDTSEKTQRAPAPTADPTQYPEIYYETAPMMQRGGLYGIRKAHSCPPSLGLGLGPSIDFRHEQGPNTPTEEEKVLIRGRPPITDRNTFQASYFTAVQEFANYARAKAQVELGFVKPHCDPVILLECEREYHPPKYTVLSLTGRCNFVGVEVNGFLFQDRRGSAPSYFGYRWL